MSETLTLLSACAAGVVLGAVFFGGLWWTIQRGVTSGRSALWFLGSLVVRMSVAAGGSYVVGGGRWERFVACLLGLLIARPLVTRLTRPAQEDRDAPHS